MLQRRRGNISRYRVGFWLILACAGVIALMAKCPITLDAGDTGISAQAIYHDGRGDVLVVLSEDAVVAARSAGEFEGSWAWIDMFRQEVGPISSIDIGALTDEVLQRYRFVVMTHSASRDTRALNFDEALHTFVTEGGSLALELPTDALRARFAADGQGGWRIPSQITATEGVDEETAAELRAMPLMTRFVGSTQPLEGAETWVAMDGAPVIYRRAYGAGQVIVFDFDVGAQLIALQQGLPGPDHRVRPRTSGAPIRTFDLVASSRLMGAEVPYADLLERYIVHALLGRERPMFALWPFPDARRGALISSHDTRSIIGRPLWMSIHERSLDARTATFIAAPDEQTSDGFVVDDVEFVGHGTLMWVLDARDANLHRRYGALGIYPVQQPLTLVGQLDRLETWLGSDADIRGVRIWDGRWTEHFTEPYRYMDAAELRYSVTYGPAPGTPPGYLFGTCQPFTPLDTNGLPFRTAEVPVCFANPQTEEERAMLLRALERASRDVWAVHLLTAADRFVDSPNMEGFDAWRDTLRFAERNQMWIGGAGELLRFWQLREAAELRVISREVTSRDSHGDPRVIEYTVEAETSGRTLVMTVPNAFGPYTLNRVTRGARHAATITMADTVNTQTSEYLGRTVHLIPLNPGFTTVGLRYSR